MMMVMWIERVQIQEGFLDGLDVSFAAGLNVIIGARGAGKSSVLELIRYALRLPHIDDRRGHAANQHAEAVLGTGQVVLTIRDGERLTTIARSAAEPIATNPVAESLNPPLVLGQNELEAIGLDAKSRLRLVDAHAKLEVSQAGSRLGALSSAVESTTLQMRGLQAQRETLRQQELLIPTITANLQAAKASEAELLGRGGEHLAEIRRSLRVATTEIAQYQTENSALKSLSDELAGLTQSMMHSLGQFVEVRASSASSYIKDQRITSELGSLNDRFAVIVQSLSKLSKSAEETVEQNLHNIAVINNNVRPLRQQFEEFEEGAAAAAQLTSQLEQQIFEIEQNADRARTLDERLNELRSKRDSDLQQIDLIHEHAWQKRKETADLLTEKFHPRMLVTLEHYGDRLEYISELSSALRGSGLQHKQLAEWLAERLSPRELVGAVEDNDSDRLSTLGEITSSRVDKLVSHLANSDSLGRILTAKVDDLAFFKLLVGRDYKDSVQLSTGQRCSVVLSMLLADSERILLLDQPEDHLDNAYLVDDTIRTLAERSNKSQTIVATHNANIPVLGNADSVLCLDSDGRRGYVRHQGGLLDTESVGLITSLMEGGKDAFARRAAFYREGTVE